MGAFLDLLKSEHFRSRTGMYVGSADFMHVLCWISGFEEACRRALPDQPQELDGFREWLHMRLEGPANVSWQGIIAWKFGEGREATERMFEQLDLFLDEMARVGRDQLIADHAIYERQRYGVLSSSRSLDSE